MASTYLDRTPSAGNRKKWTFSAWFKKSTSSASDMGIFTAGTSGNDEGTIKLYNYIDWIEYDSGTASVIGRLTTTQLLRDTSAWYHLVCVWDSANATAGDRMKMYLNGEEVTSFSADTNPSLNYDSQINNGVLHNIGRQSWNSSGYFDGSMTHVHFCDGYAYDASAFGETDATTGIWKPKIAPSVTYGTNGFFLKFENSGSMGTDSSGNANNFTVNGTMTQNIDTPSNVFATMNPLANQGTVTFSNGNLSTNQSNNNANASGTLFASKGKYYWECKSTDANTNLAFGIMRDDTQYINSDIYQVVGTIMYYKGNGQIFDNIPTSSGGVSTSYGDSWGNGDIVSCAIDLDNGYLYFAKNGVWQNSGDPTSGATGTGGISIPTGESFTAVLGNGSGSTSASCSMNFGNGYFGTTAVSSAQNPDDGIGIFEYSVPTGYKALCTKSINAQEYD